MQAEARKNYEELLAQLHEATAAGDYESSQCLMRRLAELQQAAKVTLTPSNPRAPKLAARDVVKRTRTARQVIPTSVSGLPVWGEGWRGIPNELARSGLFTVRRSAERQWFIDETIATYRNTVMIYTGPELRVRDEDVLLQTYHFQRHLGWGTSWSVGGRDFLEHLRWSPCSRGYQALYESLQMLGQGHLTIRRTAPGTPISGSTIPAIEDNTEFVLKAGNLLQLEIRHGKRGAASTITISMTPQAAALWATMGYTLVNWEQRLALSSTLARYLHRFYASHREPYPLKLSTLLELTGSATGSLGKFRQMMRSALADLVNVGFLHSYWVDGTDKVHVKRATIDTD